MDWKTEPSKNIVEISDPNSNYFFPSHLSVQKTGWTLG